MLRNWFYNEFSNTELKSVVMDSYFEKYGSYPALGGLGRCSLAALLEDLGVPFSPR